MGHRDILKEGYYSGEIPLSESWSRVSIDLDEMGIHGEPDIGKHIILYISLDIPSDFITDNLEDGVVPIEFSFDEMALENR